MYYLFSILLYFTCIFLFAAQEVHSQVTFIQPPPAGPSHNYQDNPIYKYGTSITVQWTGDIPENVDSLQLEAWRDSIGNQPNDYLSKEHSSDITQPLVTN